MPARRQLLAPTAASVTDATLFTSQSAGPTTITMINVCNTTGAAVSFAIAIGGTTATPANCIYSTAVTLAANTTLPIYGPYVLPPSTAVHGTASSTGVTFEISGTID